MKCVALRYLIAIAAMVSVSPAFAAKWLEGWVVGVADGDTLTILDQTKQQHKIRLGQIDAPESGMPYGRVAKKHLSDAVYRKTVRVQTTNTDRYGRVVGTVYLERRNINLYMVASGYAWAYRSYLTDMTYCEAERSAQHQRSGLWADKNPVPPWQWRRLTKAKRSLPLEQIRGVAEPCDIRSRSR